MPNRSVSTPTKSGLHKKVTYTLPPDVVSAVDEQWRFHKTLDASLANSKSEYIADLVRRDTAMKSGTAVPKPEVRRSTKTVAASTKRQE